MKMYNIKRTMCFDEMQKNNIIFQRIQFVGVSKASRGRRWSFCIHNFKSPCLTLLRKLHLAPKWFPTQRICEARAKHIDRMCGKSLRFHQIPDIYSNAAAFRSKVINPVILKYFHVLSGPAFRRRRCASPRFPRPSQQTFQATAQDGRTVGEGLPQRAKMVEDIFAQQ